MKTLRVMTPDFELQGEITRYTSLRITRSFFGTGDFVLHLPGTARSMEQITRGSRLFAPSSPKKMMIVEDLEYKEEAQDWTIKGPLLDGLVKWRICVPPQIMGEDHFGWDRPPREDAESLFHHFINNNLVQPEDEKRAIPRLVLAENQHRGKTNVYWQGRFDPMDQLMEELGEYTDMGWDIQPDFEHKQYVFDVHPGRDLSVGNGGATHVIVSLRMGNASGMTHTITSSSLRNLAYVGGKGEDEERLILTVGGIFTGLDRREIWVDGGSVEEYPEIEMLGERKLTDNAEKVCIKGSVQSSGVFRFGRDWDVGDIVTLQMETGAVNARIIEVTEAYESGRPVRVDIVAGDSPVTLADAMNRRFGTTVR